MSWGKGITIAFITFALFIGSLVTVCVRQDISLVSKNYYDEELKYQDQIDRLENAAALAEKPFILVRNGQLEVQFSEFAKLEEGELILTRPSDARYDAKFTVSLGSDSIRIYDLSMYPTGRYNTSLRWQMNGKEFLIQESISL
jgi:hypothetical protein